MPETPQVPIMIAMILVTIYMSVSGVETLGRWSIWMFSFVVFIVLVTTFLSVPKMDFSNILPVMEHSAKSIALGSYRLFAFPFAETVVFLCLADSVRKEDNPYKIYIYAILFSTLIFLVVLLRNIFLLGPQMLNTSFFPSFTTARIIDIGNSLARIEGSIAVNYILSGIVKITVCLIVAAKGIAKLFHTNNDRSIIFPMGLLMVAFSAIVYDSAMEMFDFLEIYQYYAIPFQIMIPLLIWVLAEIKARRHRGNKPI
jgi:spore germination protein KB